MENSRRINIGDSVFSILCAPSTTTLMKIRLKEDDNNLPHCDIYIIGELIGSDIFYSIGCMIDDQDTMTLLSNIGSFHKEDIINNLSYMYAKYLFCMKEANNIHPTIDWNTYIVEKYNTDFGFIVGVKLDIDTSKYII